MVNTKANYSDFLVIGSGIAGLIYALEVADLGKVTVLCKSNPLEGSTQYAQGGIASVIDPLDSFKAHIEDTLVAGAGLCREEVVRTVVTEGPDRIRDLVHLGARFDREEDGGDYALGKEGGHSARRILHARDATGAEIQRTVYEKALKHPNITIHSHHIAIDLIATHCDKKHEKEIIGAYVLDKKIGDISPYSAKLTMLATGGVGKVYLYTSNPDVATGDGIAMAYRAGAKISNMEFIQFHPTCLYHPGAKSFLITEAIRGEGALLKNLKGERFMPEYHALAELAPRDIVARAIDDQMKKHGHDYVLLDISHRDAQFIKDRFPNIYAKTKEFGFDLTTAPIPVVPAAHYCCGGVQTNINAETSLKRLFCAGECASTGLHGANRLASNSLLEALVFAHRAATTSRSIFSNITATNVVAPWDYVNAASSEEEVLVSHMWDEVRRTMWNLVGIVRSDKRLKLAKKRISSIKEDIREYYWNYSVTADLIELRNIVEIASVIIECALSRRESRGLHYNIDCPELDDLKLKTDTIIEKQIA